MPCLTSKYFGELSYASDAVFEFPCGIPGFEHHSVFVFLEQHHTQPLVFMQSLQDPGLCFIAVPVKVVEPGYEPELSSEDRAAVQLAPDLPIEIGREVLCLALVTVSEDSDPTANLASPIVLNLSKRIGIQAVSESSQYSRRHPLVADTELVPCS